MMWARYRLAARPVESDDSRLKGWPVPPSISNHIEYYSMKKVDLSSYYLFAIKGVFICLYVMELLYSARKVVADYISKILLQSISKFTYKCTTSVRISQPAPFSLVYIFILKKWL